jgi:hypothetical protein
MIKRLSDSSYIQLKVYTALKNFFKATTKNTSYSKKGWHKTEQPTQFPELNPQNIFLKFKFIIFKILINVIFNKLNSNNYFTGKIQKQKRAQNKRSVYAYSTE